MREAISEFDRVIDEVRADHEAAMTRRLQGARQQKILRDKAGELTGKASLALRKGRPFRSRPISPINRRSGSRHAGAESG